MSGPPDGDREVRARGRWHAVWVLIRESLRHPNTAKMIHVEGQSSDDRR